MRTTAFHIMMLMALLVTFNGFAQSGSDQLPDSLRFTIRKNYRPVARDAKKIESKPEVKHDTASLAEMNYEVLSKTKEITYEAPPLQAATLSNEPLQKLYNGFAKVGFGNYTMPFAEVSFSSLRSKKYEAGFFSRYHASFAKLENRRNFGFTDGGITGFGKYFLKDHVLSGKLYYDVDENYCYGFNKEDVTFQNVSAVLGDSMHQVFHHGGFDMDLAALQDKKLRIFDKLAVGYQYTRDQFQAQEHHAALSGGVAFNIKKEQMFISTSFDYYNLAQPSLTSNNLIWSIQPEFRAKRERWAIDLGVNFALDVNDTTTKVLVFPVLDFHYFIVRDILRFYVGAKGGVQRNGLRSISQVNPFFLTDQPFSNSWERLNIYGGFKGSITRSIGFDLSVAQIITGQQMFFVNDTVGGLGHKFLTEYHDVSVTSFKGALSYQLVSKLALSAQAEYRLFKMPTDSIRPWHESPFRFTFSGNYNLQDKFIFKAAISAFGPRVVRTFGTDEGGNFTMIPETLKGYADASIGVEYRYRKWIGAFIDFRNIASFRNEVWKQYETQGFSFIAGLHFSF